MRTGAILQASIHEKDTVKALGAQWHPMLKKWFVPENGDLSIFSKWLPEQTGGGPVFAFTPIYLVKSTDICQRCGEKTAVFCLASDGFVADGYFHENFFVTYGYLENIPECLNQYFRENCPTYYIDYSKSTDSSYCMNHCTCGAKRGDFYLHSEPSGGFFPMREAEAKEIILTKISFLTYYLFELNAGPNQQYPNPIQEFAQRC